MKNLTPDLRLHRKPNTRVYIDSSNNIQLRIDDRLYDLGPHGLAILDAFYQPTSMSEAIQKLSPTVASAQDWIALTNTIVQLYEAGVLQDKSQSTQQLETGKFSFGAPELHVRMLNDQMRTSRFLAGISEVVNPGDVVVDIGTGTGILAMAAARAGAQHVYAIEASAIGECAQEIFEANGLSDRITLLKGWSTRLELPERADVLVSEIIGDEPLGENVLEITADARKRLLKPAARLIPGKVRIVGLPVTIPYSELSERFPTTENLRNWRSWYSIDFSPLAESTQDPPPAFFIKPHKARSWIALSEPVVLAEVDLNEADLLMIDNSVVTTTCTSGRLDGLLVYFDLELGPTTRLSTHPARVDASCSWRSLVWVLQPSTLEVGDQFEVTYRYRAAAASHELTVSRV
jgi:type I protein arginine methyltransferase